MFPSSLSVWKTCTAPGFAVPTAWLLWSIGMAHLQLHPIFGAGRNSCVTLDTGYASMHGSFVVFFFPMLLMTVCARHPAPSSGTLEEYAEDGGYESTDPGLGTLQGRQPR